MRINNQINFKGVILAHREAFPSKRRALQTYHDIIAISRKYNNCNNLHAELPLPKNYFSDLLDTLCILPGFKRIKKLIAKRQNPNPENAVLLEDAALQLNKHERPNTIHRSFSLDYLGKTDVLDALEVSVQGDDLLENAIMSKLRKETKPEVQNLVIHIPDMDDHKFDFVLSTFGEIDCAAITKKIFLTTMEEINRTLASGRIIPHLF